LFDVTTQASAILRPVEFCCINASFIVLNVYELIFDRARPEIKKSFT
jgi:hypothetical protein